MVMWEVRREVNFRHHVLSSVCHGTCSVTQKEKIMPSKEVVLKNSFMMFAFSWPLNTDTLSEPKSGNDKNLE